MKPTEKIMLGLIALAALAMFLMCTFPETAGDVKDVLGGLFGFFRGAALAVATACVQAITQIKF